MGTDPPDFLALDPTAIDAVPDTPKVRELPAAVILQLMSLPGVDGVWVERQDDGAEEVVIYVTQASALHSLPTVLEGMVVRPRLGDLIRAGVER